MAGSGRRRHSTFVASATRVVVPAVPYYITQWGNFLLTFGFTKERKLNSLCSLSLCGCEKSGLSIRTFCPTVSTCTVTTCPLIPPSHKGRPIINCNRFLSVNEVNQRSPGLHQRNTIHESPDKHYDLSTMKLGGRASSQKPPIIGFPIPPTLTKC
jgi:hypothetical protein